MNFTSGFKSSCLDAEDPSAIAHRDLPEMIIYEHNDKKK